MKDCYQILLEAQKDLRDEIKMRIDERGKFYTQAMIFCGAILAFGLGQMGGKIAGGLVLCGGPFVALSYWRLLIESCYMHDKIKIFLANQIEPRLDAMVDPNYVSWQRYCVINGKGVTGRHKNSLFRILGSDV